MICPNKICAQEIPDDSCFCDQCGTQILRCEKCAFISISKRCGKCGGVMAAIEPPASQSTASPNVSVPDAASVPAANAPADSPAIPVSTATVIVQLPTEKIFLCSTEGWNLEISNGDILGRTNGQHTAKLGKFPVISSNHAKVSRQNNEWFITDLNSTNKTFVNGVKLESNVPARIKQNDVVILANVNFTVRET